MRQQNSSSSRFLNEATGLNFLSYTRGALHSFIKHFHFTEPDANSLTRKQNIEELKKTADYIWKKWGDRVAWLSYGEMGEHFKRVDRVKFEVEERRGELVLKTQNSKEELEGITFVFEEKPRKVKVLDREGEEVKGDWSKSLENYLFVIVEDGKKKPKVNRKGKRKKCPSSNT